MPYGEPAMVHVTISPLEFNALKDLIYKIHSKKLLPSPNTSEGKLLEVAHRITQAYTFESER